MCWNLEWMLCAAEWMDVKYWMLKRSFKKETNFLWLTIMCEPSFGLKVVMDYSCFYGTDLVDWLINKRHSQEGCDSTITEKSLGLLHSEVCRLRLFTFTGTYLHRYTYNLVTVTSEWVVTCDIIIPSMELWWRVTVVKILCEIISLGELIECWIKIIFEVTGLLWHQRYKFEYFRLLW